MWQRARVRRFARGRYRKCGKRNCHCSKKGSIGHGPSYSLTHPIAGKTVTKIIPAGASVDRTRDQLDEYHPFRRLVQQLTTVSEQICDLQPRQSESDDNKKNFARRPPRGGILWDIEALLGRQNLGASIASRLISFLKDMLLIEPMTDN